MKRLLLGAALALVAVVSQVLAVGASWEWCEYDPMVQLDHTGGKVVTVYATLFAPLEHRADIATASSVSITWQAAADFYSTKDSSVNSHQVFGQMKLGQPISNHVTPMLDEIARGQMHVEHMHPAGAMPNRYVFTFAIPAANGDYPVLAVISTAQGGNGNVLAWQPGYADQSVLVELHI